MLEQALQGARLLYAYTLYIDAPLSRVFRFTGDPAAWALDFEGNPQPRLTLLWEGKPYTPGSIMTLTVLRPDSTPTPVGAVRMELLYYIEDVQISFRFLNGTHLIYSFFYEEKSPTRTELNVNVFIDAQSSSFNTMRQRLYANRRRKASIQDHLRVKAELEKRARGQ